MSEQSKDRLEGAWDEAKGKGKQAWGELTGDEQKQAEGKVDEAKGKAEQAMANVKEKVSDAKDSVNDMVKKITGNDSSK
ncbi:MAG: CsbD family protein [Chloroflexota bacterium]